MKRKEIMITLSITFTLFLLVSQPSVYQVKSDSSFSGWDSMSITSSHTAIHIQGDEELDSNSVSGDGGSSTPYIIRDLDIDTGSAVALRIEDTTKHFEIRNCTLTAMYGIYLDNVTGGTSRIENNTVYGCNSVAIYLTNTNGSWIVDNTLINNHRGISINYCYASHIIDNYLNNRDAGIFSRYSPYTSLVGNQMYGDGFEILDESVEDLLTIAVSTTTVNDKPLIYWESEEGKTIPSGAGQIVLVDCDEIEIIDQVLQNTADGVLACFSSDISIHDNYIINNKFPGIFV